MMGDNTLDLGTHSSDEILSSRGNEQKNNRPSEFTIDAGQITGERGCGSRIECR